MKFKIDIDTYREILDTLTRNKSRSILTGFGIFWGVFMLVALIGGGNGLQQLMAANFSGFAHNSAIVWTSPTSKPYNGFRKGRIWDMDQKDVDRLRQQVPQLDVISPMVFIGTKSVVYSDKKMTAQMKGTLPSYAQVEEPKLYYGRYFNQIDINEHRKVCIIGKKIYKTLFPHGGDPTGKTIRVDSIYYAVIGVDYAPGNMSINGSTEESVFIPLPVVQQTYNLGKSVHVITMTGHLGVRMNTITQKIRSVIAQAHQVDPTDEKSIKVLNTELLFTMVDNLFTGVNFLVWLVGIGTLLAGAVGVSNIMMVTVRERTSEIGIRRAIGATPLSILWQIISESLLLTIVAGMSGIMFAVCILQMVQMGNTTDGIETAHFQVQFWTAIGAMAFLGVLGATAGLAPAIRAMRIKPVEAMRDE